jgi:plastocyanin
MTNQPKSWILAGIALLAGGVACGGGSDGGPPASGLRTVLVVNDQFQPVTSTISAGDTIVWAWGTGSNTHNIISTGTPNFVSKGTTLFPGSAGTDYFNSPASYQVIFNTAGTYEYYCSQHGTSTGAPGGNSGMHGVIKVNP